MILKSTIKWDSPSPSHHKHHPEWANLTKNLSGKEMEGDFNFEFMLSIGHKAVDFCTNITNLTSSYAGTH